MAATTTTKSSDASVSSSANYEVGAGSSGGPVQEDVVYYSFSVPAHLGRAFSGGEGQTDSTLADIEATCRCSIMVNARRQQQQQQQQLHQKHNRTDESSVTVEVLMDELGGDFAGSASQLADLTRRLGGRWRIRRLIRRLSLANGTKKYRMEQQSNTLSPDSGHLEDSFVTGATTTAAGEFSSCFVTPGSVASSSSLVVSFADEAADGQWSLYSVVSPFLELELPPLGQELTKNLWVHAVGMLAQCTRQMSTDAATEALIAAAATTMQVSNDGDSLAAAAGESSSGDDDDDDPARAVVCRNYSHEPEPTLTLLVTALFCDTDRRIQEEDDDDDEDMIDTFVSGVSTSNSLLMAEVLNADRLSPMLSAPLEPLLPTSDATTLSRELRHAVSGRQHAQATISTCRTSYQAHLTSTVSRAATVESQLSLPASGCLQHQASPESGSLGSPLNCSDPLRRCHQLTQERSCFSAVAGSDHCGSFQQVDTSVPADGTLLAAGLSSSHPSSDSASRLAAVRCDEATATARRLATPSRASGHRGGSTTLLASSACDTAPLAARKCSLASSSAHRGSRSACQQDALPATSGAASAAAGKSALGESLLVPAGCEECHAGATVGPSTRHRNAPWETVAAEHRGCAASTDGCQQVACGLQPQPPLPPLLVATETTKLSAADASDSALAQCRRSHHHSVMSSAASGGRCNLPAACERRVGREDCDLLGLRADDRAALSPSNASVTARQRLLPTTDGAAAGAPATTVGSLDPLDGHPAVERRLASVGDHHRRLARGPELTARPLACEFCPTAGRLNSPATPLDHRQVCQIHGVPAHQGVRGGDRGSSAAAAAFDLAPPQATSASVGVVRDDCQRATSAMASTCATVAVEWAPPPTTTTTSGGLERQERCQAASLCVRTRLDGADFAPVEARSPAPISSAVHGISCSVQRGAVAASAASHLQAAAYTLTFAPLDDSRRCFNSGCAGSLQRSAAAPLLTSSPQVELHCHCASSQAGCLAVSLGCRLAEPARSHVDLAMESATLQTVVAGSNTDGGCHRREGRQHRLGCPLTELHRHGVPSGSGHCVSLGRDTLVAASRRLNQFVVETSVGLASVCGSGGGGRDTDCSQLINGSQSWCRHGLQAVCQVGLFDQRGRNRSTPTTDEWQQLASLIAGSISALEWSSAWPHGSLDCHLQAAASAAVEVCEARASWHKDLLLLGGLGSGEVTLCSELVWESRRRIQLAQSMLN